MKLNRIVRSIMRGNQRDTTLLFTVVLLMVLFMTAISTFISSLREFEKVEREELYGRWQTMWYAADAGIKSEVEQAVPTLSAQFVADKSNYGTVVAASKEWIEIGSITLREGRLPSIPGEIALVALPQNTDVAVGDLIEVEYSYYHVYQPWKELDENEFLQPYYDSLSEIEMSELSTWWDEYIQDNPRYLPETNSDGSAMLFNDMSESGKIGAYGQQQFVMGKFSTSSQVERKNRSAFKYDENTRFRLDSHQFVRTLYGELANPDGGSTDMMTNDFDQALYAWRNYNVVGIVEPYAQLWDSGELQMPDAFVAVAEAEHMNIALKWVEDTWETEEFVPQYILFSGTAENTPTEIYDTLFPIYAAGNGRYEIYANESTTSDKVGISIAGIDMWTGKIDSLSLTLSHGSWLNAKFDNYDEEQGFHTINIRDLRNGTARLEGLNPMPLGEMSAEDAYVDQGTRVFRLNTFSYPLAGGTATDAIGRIASVGMYVVAFFAVFQIYLAQSRRRGRRGSVMKSVGATSGQVFAINLLEGGFIILAALPIGITLGFGAAWFACRYGGNAGMAMVVEGKSFAMGIVGCVLAMIAGMLLTGALSARPSTGHNRPMREQKQRKAQRRGLFSHMLRITGVRKTVVMTLLVTLYCSALLMAIFLGNNAFSKYRSRVENVDMPSYTLTLSYATGRKYAQEIASSIGSAEGLSNVRVFPMGENIFLDCTDKLETSPLISELLAHYGEQSGVFNVIQQEDGSNITSICCDLYAVDFSDEYMMTELEAAVGASLDTDMLTSGKACILIQPRVDSNFSLSASLENSYFYDVINTYEVGEVASLSATTKRNTETSVVLNTESVKVQVAGIINSTDIYPFSVSTNVVTIIGSDSLLRELYPLAGQKMSVERVGIYEVFWYTQLGDSYGRTRIFLDADPSFISVDSTVRDAAALIGASVQNYRFANEKMYSEATNGMIMIAALCAMIGTIVYAIYINIASSAVDGESHHIGVLHAVGAPRGVQIACYALYALMVGVFAEIAANLLVAGVAIVVALIQNGGAMTVDYFLEVVLFGYPWAVHIALMATTLVLCVGAYFKAAARVCRRTPLDNIRS